MHELFLLSEDIQESAEALAATSQGIWLPS
jgi:hypothetical protein